MEAEEISVDDFIYKAEIETDIEKKRMDIKGGSWGWDELRVWD